MDTNTIIEGTLKFRDGKKIPRYRNRDVTKEKRTAQSIFGGWIGFFCSNGKRKKAWELFPKRGSDANTPKVRKTTTSTVLVGHPTVIYPFCCLKSSPRPMKLPRRQEKMEDSVYHVLIMIQGMDTTKLINGVQSRKALWDRSDKLYHNRDVTKDLWHEVCLELGLDPSTAIDMVKKRWNSLRDVFRREYIKATSNDTNSSVWFYYDSMSFLISQMRPPRPITVELVDSQDYEQYEDSSTEICDYQNETAQIAAGKRVLPFEFVAESHENRPQKLARREERRASDETDDSDYHFLMSMLPFLKAQPLHKKMATRIKILEIIKAEEESIDTALDEPRPSNSSSQVGIQTKIDSLKKEMNSTSMTTSEDC